MMLKPGATIGILGGGQLGRMLAIAAARLGFHCHIYCPEAGSPAFEVARDHTVAAYEDEAALAIFAAKVDVVTLEFENVPVAALRFLAARVLVAPSADALEIAQDRLAEKTFATKLGLGTAPFADIPDAAALETGLARIGTPSILKTRRFGYDGKGQVKIMAPVTPHRRWPKSRVRLPFSKASCVFRARSPWLQRARPMEPSSPLT